MFLTFVLFSTFKIIKSRYYPKTHQVMKVEWLPLFIQYMAFFVFTAIWWAYIYLGNNPIRSTPIEVSPES